ncbi:MAG: GNAT family N-acetyltransferase [Dehalococcoidales bacterium]|nr:GNAT family N-acetyltransferase [Dehalococcoidales bacterium]
MTDARDDYAWQTDPELVKLDAASVLDMSYQQYMAEFHFELCYPLTSRHEFSVDTLDGEHIGNCVYYNVNQVESKAELGIMIGNRKYWNKGYGVEVVNALLDFIFDKTHLERIYLTTLDWNIRAQKCFAKCGFREYGHITRGEHNFLLMAIHRHEWLKLREESEAQDGALAGAEHESRETSD